MSPSKVEIVIEETTILDVKCQTLPDDMFDDVVMDTYLSDEICMADVLEETTVLTEMKRLPNRTHTKAVVSDGCEYRYVKFPENGSVTVISGVTNNDSPSHDRPIVKFYSPFLNFTKKSDTLRNRNREKDVPFEGMTLCYVRIVAIFIFHTMQCLLERMRLWRAEIGLPKVPHQRHKMICSKNKQIYDEKNRSNQDVYSGQNMIHRDNLEHSGNESSFRK